MTHFKVFDHWGLSDISTVLLYQCCTETEMTVKHVIISKQSQIHELVVKCTKWITQDYKDLQASSAWWLLVSFYVPRVSKKCIYNSGCVEEFFLLRAAVLFYT